MKKRLPKLFPKLRNIMSMARKEWWKRLRSLWGIHCSIILAGKRIPPQNEAEGMDSSIHYIPKMLKLRWLKTITRFTKYLPYSWLEAYIDYSPGSWVSSAKCDQLLLSVAVAHQAFENVTEPWDPVHYCKILFGFFNGLNCFNLLDSRQQFFSLCAVQLTL